LLPGLNQGSGPIPMNPTLCNSRMRDAEPQQDASKPVAINAGAERGATPAGAALDGTEARARAENRSDRRGGNRARGHRAPARGA
jgi:hypothetical protein